MGGMFVNQGGPMKRAFIFPGQGAQYVGMGKTFYEAFPSVRELFARGDEVLSDAMTKRIFEGPAEELSLTKYSQPAIFLTSMAVLTAMQQEFPEIEPVVTAGLSLGEYSALVAANVLSFEDALNLVATRGSLMHQVSLERPGSLAVVLGLELESVQEYIESIEDVWVANLNCPGQIVLSGSHDGLAEASDVLKKNGAKRVLPLDVSGAFHSPFMEPARITLETEIASRSFQKPACGFVMNVPGDFVEDVDQIRENLGMQVVSPVLWEKGIHAIEAIGIDQFVEIGCGTTLAGLNKRIKTKVPTISIDTVEDLSKLGAHHAAEG